LNLKRIYVHESIYEKFRDSLVKHVKAYVLGDGSKEGISHGPLQNSMQYERVKTFFDDIEKQGWKVAVGGKIEPSSGYFITPTIIDNPAEDSRIVVEEPFGMHFLFSLLHIARLTQFTRPHRTTSVLEE
jgi:acyl-CoA reductase-like NAD-dependent aldehyde dehydrogenase